VKSGAAIFCARPLPILPFEIAMTPPEGEPLSLLDNRFVRVERWPRSGLVRVTRSAEPIVLLEEVDEAWGAVLIALDDAPRSGERLLIDMRRAPGRNDDAYERSVARYRAETVARFEQVAVLVRSMPGQLQVQRHAKEDGLSKVRVFNSEPHALAWLTPSRVSLEPRTPGTPPVRR
jgi:hypothetical protein